MRPTALVCLLMLAMGPAWAQDCLEPDTSVLGGEYDSYVLKVYELFKEGYSGDELLRVVFLESFQPESLVGIRRTHEGVELFELQATIPIWNTELLRDHESGRIETFDASGKKLSLDEDESYQRLKRETPSDFRNIPIERTRAPLDQQTADQIAAIWQTMLLNAKHPMEASSGFDGATYHFSMWIRGRGNLSAHIWSPDAGSKTERLVSLASSMRKYARGAIPLANLQTTVKEAVSILGTSNE